MTRDALRDELIERVDAITLDGTATEADLPMELRKLALEHAEIANALP